MQQPSTGRIVHYVLPRHLKNAGQIRPAIIVRVWQGIESPEAPGLSNLVVFLDGLNDRDRTDGLRIAEHSMPIDWVGSVLHDAEGRPGTWHWPPHVSATSVNLGPGVNVAVER